jgi:hypothetical protein
VDRSGPCAHAGARTGASTTPAPERGYVVTTSFPLACPASMAAWASTIWSKR